jgi:hypothetical protein
MAEEGHRILARTLAQSAGSGEKPQTRFSGRGPSLVGLWDGDRVEGSGKRHRTTAQGIGERLYVRPRDFESLGRIAILNGVRMALNEYLHVR